MEQWRLRHKTSSQHFNAKHHGNICTVVTSNFREQYDFLRIICKCWWSWGHLRQSNPHEGQNVSISVNPCGMNVSQRYHALFGHHNMLPSDFCLSIACSFVLLLTKCFHVTILLSYGSQWGAVVAMMRDALAKDTYVYEIVNVRIDNPYSCSLLAQGQQYKPHSSRINVVLSNCDIWSWGSNMPSRWTGFLILDNKINVDAAHGWEDIEYESSDIASFSLLLERYFAHGGCESNNGNAGLLSRFTDLGDLYRYQAMTNRK
jgi:hypothetical protein